MKPPQLACGSSEKHVIPNHMKFLIGGLSGMGATLVVDPLELVKNRMQLSREVVVKNKKKRAMIMTKEIVRKEGLSALYKGMSASILRQGTYTTTRLGVYTYLFDKMCGPQGQPPSFTTKAGIGMVAGAAGAVMGTPAELCLIRMTSDGVLPREQRRNYTGIGNALSRVAKEEGLATLWRGVLPTMGRAMVVNAAQLSSYSQTKQMLIDTGYFTEGIILHFISSMISGRVTTAASMPFDIVKTRIQNMKTDGGQREYKSATDVLLKVVRNEGFFALWKGFGPYYARLGPHTVLTFIFLEQLNLGYKMWVYGDAGVGDDL